MIGGSSRTRRLSARRARATRRWRRSPIRGVPGGGRVAFPVDGRSTTRRSTARPLSRAPAIDRPSSRPSGVTTTSQSRLTPRATASTGSKLCVRSSQATIEPVAWAWATVRRAIVVLPLDPSPRSPTHVDRGNPLVPRIASSASKPVETTPSAGVCRGSGRGSSSSSGSGTVASAPTTSPTSPTGRGAAAPQRDWRVARAAVTSGDRVAMREALSNICSMSVKPNRDPRRHSANVESSIVSHKRNNRPPGSRGNSAWAQPSTK
jgi:hypothetical protein